MSEALEERARRWGTFDGAEKAWAARDINLTITEYVLDENATESAKASAEAQKDGVIGDMDTWVENYKDAYRFSYRSVAGNSVVAGKYLSMKDLLIAIDSYKEDSKSLRCYHRIIDGLEYMEEIVVYNDTNGAIVLKQYVQDALLASLEQGWGIKEAQTEK